MALRQQKGRVRAGQLQKRDEATNFAVEIYSSPKQADCQSLQLSPDSLSRAGLLAGDLACWLLRRLPSKNLPDPQFLPTFERALMLLEIEDTLLRRAGAMEAGK
jgi:hypothetical protein